MFLVVLLVCELQQLQKSLLLQQKNLVPGRSPLASGKVGLPALRFHPNFPLLVLDQLQSFTEAVVLIGAAVICTASTP